LANQCLDKVDEATVAAMLSASSIFLSFSDFEGLPLPPLEAALAGNLVIGYTGQGAREYWEAPNFLEINQGDIQGFVAATCKAIEAIDTMRLTRDDLNPLINRLTERFSTATEEANVRMLLTRIEQCLA
jgi:glycosyltransferase involved in cell wall biosynthesis